MAQPGPARPHSPAAPPVLPHRLAPGTGPLTAHSLPGVRTTTAPEYLLWPGTEEDGATSNGGLGWPGHT